MTLKCIFLIHLLLLISNIINCKVFTKSGSISGLQHAQEAVIRNEKQASAYYIHYNNTGILITISLNNNKLPNSLSYKKKFLKEINSNNLIQITPEFLYVMIGNAADCHCANKILNSQMKSFIRDGNGDLPGELAVLTL